MIIMLRLSRYRFRTEGLAVILALVIAAAVYYWAGATNPPQISTYDEFEARYASLNRTKLSQALGIPEDELGSTLEETYSLFIKNSRGYFYVRVIFGTYIANYLIPCALSMVLLCRLFARRRVSSWLCAGLSRARVYFSLTLVYYVCTALVWLVAVSFILKHFSLRYTGNELPFFYTTQFSWFSSYLSCTAIAYMAAFLLRGPLPSALAGVGAWVILLLFRSAIPYIPLNTIPSVFSWEPGADLTNLIVTNYVAVGVFILSLPVGWLSFRIRGQE